PSIGVAQEVSALLDVADDYHSMDPDRQEKVLDPIAKMFSEFAEYEELGFQWNVHRPAGSTDDAGPWTLQITGEESGNIEHAAELVQWLLPRLDIKAAGFEYCGYGSGEYGGGAVAVVMTDDGPKAEWMNTCDWLIGKLK
ncbi:MAG TPA: hypothetical protein VNA25_11755, partial [Phycisphaerae bacterium]|nr:hypothetical protein [Phycisphaerae bacterium]